VTGDAGLEPCLPCFGEGGVDEGNQEGQAPLGGDGDDLQDGEDMCLGGGEEEPREGVGTEGAYPFGECPTGSEGEGAQRGR